MDTQRPSEILAAARKAASDGDVARAAELYEYFYDHALETDMHLAGVRLSYCIMEWADLADRLPSVRVRLNEKRAAALARFEQSGAGDSFHDYVSLCGLLGLKEEAVECFLRLLELRPDDAKACISLIWKDLADAGHYAVCARHLDRIQMLYDAQLRQLDHMIQMSQIDARFSDPGFLEVRGRHFIEDARRIHAILKHGDSAEAARVFAAQVTRDLQARKMTGLAIE